jgi:hypothetical protein
MILVTMIAKSATRIGRFCGMDSRKCLQAHEHGYPVKEKQFRRYRALATEGKEELSGYGDFLHTKYAK